MKYIVVLGDGMADEPIPALGGRTPLDAAVTPVLDELPTFPCWVMTQPPIIQADLPWKPSASAFRWRMTM